MDELKVVLRDTIFVHTCKRNLVGLYLKVLRGLVDRWGQDAGTEGDERGQSKIINEMYVVEESGQAGYPYKNLNKSIEKKKIAPTPHKVNKKDKMEAAII